MNQKSYMPIKEFSRLTGIKRDNLRFYDRIGLLVPETRGENGYRYYSRRQLNSAYLISELRELGVGLDSIKEFSQVRTPERMLELFEEQEKHIQAEMKRLEEMRQIMAMRTDSARKALQHRKDTVQLEEKGREPIFLGPPFPDHLTEDEEAILSYDYADQQGVNLGFPLGSIISQENFKAGQVSRVQRHYLKTANGNAWKPEGRYAAVYGYCNPRRPDAVYQRLLTFIQERGLQMIGDVYEEYPLDELAIQDEDQFCVRIEIQVKE